MPSCCRQGVGGEDGAMLPLCLVLEKPSSPGTICTSTVVSPHHPAPYRASITSVPFHHSEPV